MREPVEARARNSGERARPGRAPRTLLLALLALFAVFFATAHAQVSVSATVSNPSPSVGEPVQLQLRCEGTNRAGQPPPVQVDGLDIRYLGPSTQMQIVNGAMSASVTHVYQVIAMRMGTFTIPAIELEIDGRRLRTAPVEMNVTAVNPNSGQGGAAPMDKVGFAEITLPKTTAYVGESLPAEIRLFIDTRVQSQIETLPQLQGEGFTKTKLTEPRREMARRDGREYNVITFRTAITPGKAGRIAIGPTEFSFLAQVPRAQRRGRSLFDTFDDIFNSGPFAATQRMTVRAEAVELDVKPLPVQGRPADFSDAVGDFRLAAEGSPATVKMGDPVTIRLRISGRGNFDRVSAPTMTDVVGWRSYPPSQSFTAEDELAISGVKTFEMAVIPETHKTEMPEFAFSYFDPTAEKYVTLTSESAALIVQGAPPPPPPPVAKPADAEPAEPEQPPAPPAAADILGLHYDIGTVRGSFEPLYARREFLLAQLIPLAVLLAMIARRFLHRSEDDRARAALVREKEALRRKLRGESAHAEFFDTAARLIQIETALRTGQPAGSVDAARACASRLLDTETTGAVSEIFNARAELLYAGGGGGNGSVSGAERERVIAAIEKFQGAGAPSPRGSSGGRGLLLSLSLLAIATSAHAGDFEQANEHYDAGRFVEAKQLYERLFDSGTRSANLFHNLANTDYRIAAPGRAMLGYERALALEPQHPEAAANLKLLREQAHAGDLRRSVVERALLRVSENLWTVAAALGGWSAVFCLALLCLKRRDSAGLWFGLASGVVLAAGSVFGITLHQRDRALAIVTAKEVEAHLAPAESAALAGVLPAGSRVRVLSERGPWTYCELPDDRRGWVASGAIERIRPGES